MKTTPVLNTLLHTAYKHKNDANMTPLRIQKLLYLLHGWYSAIVGESLLDEPFVHGKFGPVLRGLEQDLASFSGVPVDDFLPEWDPVTLQVVPLFVNLEAAPQFAAILKQVWEVYSPLSTRQLSTLCHGPGTPWARTPAGAAILNDLIVADFTKRAQESSQASART